MAADESVVRARAFIMQGGELPDLTGLSDESRKIIKLMLDEFHQRSVGRVGPEAAATRSRIRQLRAALESQEG